MRLLPVIIFALGASVSAWGDDSEKCGTLLVSSPMALQPILKQADGSWLLSVDYSTDKPGVRAVELPSAIGELKGKRDVHIVVLAGNSGTQYENTRHSLGHTFGDYLLKTWPH